MLILSRTFPHLSFLAMLWGLTGSNAWASCALPPNNKVAIWETQYCHLLRAEKSDQKQLSITIFPEPVSSAFEKQTSNNLGLRLEKEGLIRSFKSRDRDDIS